MVDRKKSLDQLENATWGPPDHDSHLVRRCYELRRVPLEDFSTEDLRIMLGQSISVSLLAPLAIAVLERDAPAAGDFHPGDLLATLVRARGDWRHDSELVQRVLAVIDRAIAELPRRLTPELLDSNDGLSEAQAAKLRAILDECQAELTGSVRTKDSTGNSP